jgi:hypothetical protein
MRNPRQRINIALLVAGVIAVVAVVIAATAGGRSTKSGNAQACDAFWSWYQSTGSATAVLSAYREATAQPLIDDLYNVSVGLKDQGKGLGGDKAANAAFAQSAAGKVQTDCTNAGYPDPQS